MASRTHTHKARETGVLPTQIYCKSLKQKSVKLVMRLWTNPKYIIFPTFKIAKRQILLIQEDILFVMKRNKTQMGI